MIARRRLGRTGVEVSVVGFGGMELRGTAHRNPRPLDPGQADRVLGAALDAGIDLYDTSIDYGASEAAIGAALGRRRDEVFVATKCGCPLDADRMVDVSPGQGLPHDWSEANVRAGLEQSLRRLRTDRVDLLQLHLSPSRSRIDRDDAVATLLALRGEGKVRFLGCSSSLPELVDHVAMGVFDALQVPFSPLEPSHAPAMADAAAAGIGIIVRGGVARGGASGGYGAEDRWARWRATGCDEVAAGFDPVHVLLNATIAEPSVTTAIVGTASAKHLAANVAAVAPGAVPGDVVAEVRRRLS